MTTAVNCYVQLLCACPDRFAYFLVILHNQGSWDGAYQFGVDLFLAVSPACVFYFCCCWWWFFRLGTIRTFCNVIVPLIVALAEMRWVKWSAQCVSNQMRHDIELRGGEGGGGFEIKLFEVSVLKSYLQRSLDLIMRTKESTTPLFLLYCKYICTVWKTFVVALITGNLFRYDWRFFYRHFRDRALWPQGEKWIRIFLSDTKCKIQIGQTR